MLSFCLLDIVDLTKQNVTSRKQTEYWISNLKLRPEDKLIINKGKWLTDTIINAFQILLQNFHPQVGGLQDTVLAETLAFNIEKGDFVQILNLSRAPGSQCRILVVSQELLQFMTVCVVAMFQIADSIYRILVQQLNQVGV